MLSGAPGFAYELRKSGLAEVGAVYDADPIARTPADILARKPGRRRRHRPPATGPPGRGEQVVDRQRHP
jgi:hypothetical protein